MSARILHETKRVAVVHECDVRAETPKYFVFWLVKGQARAQFHTHSTIVAAIMAREDVPLWGEEHLQ